MSTINIKCVDQVLSFQNTPIITAGDQNVDKIQFDFCPTWDGFVKVAVFFKQKEECSYAMINADGSCNIPNSIMRLDGKIYVAVTGVNTKNQILTSNIVAYYIDEGIVDASLQDEFPNELDPEEQETVYNKILDMCVEMQDLCQDLIKNLAYVRIKDANEFEYDESKLEAKIKAYTYNRDQLDSVVNTVKSSLQNVQNSHIEDVRTILNNITDLTNTTRSHTNTIDDIRATLSMLTDDISQERNDRIGSIVELSDTVNGIKNSLISSINSLTSTVTQLNDRVSRLEG